jgi:hypothetical protein
MPREYASTVDKKGIRPASPEKRPDPPGLSLPPPAMPTAPDPPDPRSPRRIRYADDLRMRSGSLGREPDVRTTAFTESRPPARLLPRSSDPIRGANPRGESRGISRVLVAERVPLKAFRCFTSSRARKLIRLRRRQLDD